MESYERKIRKLKKLIKGLVVENSTLCDHIADIQQTIDVAKLEREFLVRKLIEHEPATAELLHQNIEMKPKKRKNSSSDASSIIGVGRPAGKKIKQQPVYYRKQVIKQENTDIMY